jgi:hypothetical protein
MNIAALSAKQPRAAADLKERVEALQRELNQVLARIVV